MRQEPHNTTYSYPISEQSVEQLVYHKMKYLSLNNAKESLQAYMTLVLIRLEDI